MLIWGTANPTGVTDKSYDGLYLTETDIDDMVQCMTGKPVKVEHKVGTQLIIVAHSVHSRALVGLY